MDDSDERDKGRAAGDAAESEQGDLLSGVPVDAPSDVDAAGDGQGEPPSTEATKPVPDESAGARPETPRPESSPEVPRGAVDFEMVPEETREQASPAPAGEDLARAKDLVQRGDAEGAMALYRKVLSRNPSNLKARNNLGVLLDELGQHDLALEQFEAAEKIDPENVEVLNNLGSTLAAMGHYDAAERELRRALRIDPADVEVRASLGILFFRRGVYQQAEVELRWVCEQDPSHGPAFFYRGEALNRLGRVDEAMDALERAIVLQPTNGRAFYTLGILYDRKHLTEEAGAMYRKARELTTG